MMVKKLKSLAVILLVTLFVGGSVFSSCTSKTSKEKLPEEKSSSTEEHEHPADSEHPTDSTHEHPAGSEHPSDSTEHPSGSEHPE